MSVLLTTGCLLHCLLFAKKKWLPKSSAIQIHKRKKIICILWNGVTHTIEKHGIKKKIIKEYKTVLIICSEEIMINQLLTHLDNMYYWLKFFLWRCSNTPKEKKKTWQRSCGTISLHEKVKLRGFYSDCLCLSRHRWSQDWQALAGR